MGNRKLIRLQAAAAALAIGLMPISAGADAGEHEIAVSDTAVNDYGLNTLGIASIDGAEYKDGKYEGSGTGFGGLITVEVTIENGVITSVTSPSHEGESFWNSKNVDSLLNAIVENNSVDVDAISSATRSSNGVKEAVRNALAKAVDAGIFEYGSGTEKDPYIITSPEQLAAFADAVDGGEIYEGKYIALESDIDLSQYGNWNPIGTEATANTTTGAENLGYVFNGSFDGRGHTVSGMTIVTEEDAPYTSEVNIGLFSTLNKSAAVKNINMEDVAVDVKGTEVIRAGAIAGDTVSAENAPGIIGTRVDTCSAQGSIKASTDEAKLVFGGGIIGRANISTAITNCWSDTDISTASKGGNHSAYAGGIIGTSGNNAIIINCAAFGNNYANSPKSTNFGGMAGGISAMFAGKQWNTYAMGNATVGNGGTAHKWVGALHGEVTTSGMIKNGSDHIYPDTGALRDYSYYADDITLTIEDWSNGEANGSETELTAAGSSTTINTFDHVFETSENVKALPRNEMNTQAFADTLNSNLLSVSKLMTAYETDSLSLNNWVLENNRVVPTGEIWMNTVPDSEIFAKGTGTAEDPFMIETKEQLLAFAASQTNGTDYSGCTVQLGADIDISGADWEPIGGMEYAFNGVFDGAGHTISGLTMGTKDEPLALTTENYIAGLFGILDSEAVIKDLALADVDINVKHTASIYAGAIAGYMGGNSASKTGAVIDGCSVRGAVNVTADKGNTWAAGIVGYQYYGAVINSMTDVDVSCIVKHGDAVAEAGGLVALNNRGLVAHCYTLGDVYGSASRNDGDEGMASISALVGVQAGGLADCYSMGDHTTGELSVYTGAVAGWVTGIGKAYDCWYNAESKMTIGTQTVTPVESIGTKVAGGVNEEDDAYVGGLIDDINGFTSDTYSSIADDLNSKFEKFPIDITSYGIGPDALRTWVYDDNSKLVTFGDGHSTAAYVQPEVEIVPVVELAMRDGDWYGRDNDKTTVVKITVADGEITDTSVIMGEAEGDAYTAAYEKAREKAIYGDTTDYAAADTSVFAGGSGTAEDPYLISDEGQLRYIAKAINEDNSWENVYFKQTADIALTGGDWLPIGWGIYTEIKSQGTQYCIYPFRGNYDGDNYVISDLTIGTAEKPSEDVRANYTAAMFGITVGGYNSNEAPAEGTRAVELKNIVLRDVDINISSRYQNYTAGLVGSAQNGFVIDNCSVTGNINSYSSDSFARGGGISSNALRGLVMNSWADVDVSVDTDAGNSYGGGLFAMDNRATVINCYAMGNITGNSSNTNKVHIGGITGQSGGIHFNCYAMGDVVSKKPTTDVGGLNGRLAGISIDMDSYFNSDAKQEIAGTAAEEKVASGVDVTGNPKCNQTYAKTAEELGSSDFATMLNENIAKTAEKAEEIRVLLKAVEGRGYVHQLYYNGDGSDINGWIAHDGTVTFGAITKTSVTENGGKYTFDIKCRDAIDNGVIVVAEYSENNALTGLKQIECNGGSEYAAELDANGAEYAKVFVWNGLSGIVPLNNAAETVEINN